MKSLGTFSITSTESLDFARASGDFNPLHLDPVAARRSRFGQTLIHGICGTIKALDLFLRLRGKNAVLTSIKVKYSKPAVQGQVLEVMGETTDDITRLELFVAGIRCQIIAFEIVDVPEPPYLEEKFLQNHNGDPNSCVDLDIAGCTGLSDAVELLWDMELLTSLFPSAIAYLPQRQLATLIASTQVVGMRCPGLHSVFAQLDMRFAMVAVAARVSDTTHLAFNVLTADARIDRVELGIKNAYAEGTVEAFFRPPPAQQAAYEQIATLVSNGEFSNQNALVIGASRGLGEVITKVLAAGGARILMTYAVGKDDAARVSAEIGRQQGDAPGICCYDVIEGSFCNDMIEFCTSITHIYYLASPTIVKGDGNKWDHELFNRYCDFYIEGLATLLQQVTQTGLNNREFQLFIPSSIFLEQNPKGFDEYIAAKAAAEAYIKSYQKAHGNCRVVAPRLPRLHTDQTSSIKGTDSQHTLKVIVSQLRDAFCNNPHEAVNARALGEI